MRIAVDIGGTFTDGMVFDEAKGVLARANPLSTPEEREISSTNLATAELPSGNSCSAPRQSLIR